MRADLRRLAGGLVALFLSLAGAATAAAATLGDPTVPFRAERMVQVDGRSYSGVMVAAPGHQRHEQDLLGLHEVFLLDTQKRQGFLVLPGLKTYVEFPFPALMAELDAPDLLRRPVGREMVSGLATTKYRVDHRAQDGSRATGFVWVTRSGILMKFDLAIARPHGGKPLALYMELAHVETGPVDPALFDLPANFLRLPGEALAPLMGGEKKPAFR